MNSRIPAESNHEADAQQRAILEVAIEALKGLSQQWRRIALPLITGEGDYTPESVNHILRSWVALQVAAEGATINYEGNAGTGGQGRLGIAAMLADVEQATDLALADVSFWHAVWLVYVRQGRMVKFDQVRIDAGLARGSARGEPEPPYPFNWQLCCERIARALGWQGYDGERA